MKYYFENVKYHKQWFKNVCEKGVTYLCDKYIFPTDNNNKNKIKSSFKLQAKIVEQRESNY